MRLFWSIILGFFIVTVVCLRAEVAEGRGAWIKVHEVSLEQCVKSGGINEHDMDFNVSVCHIQDFNLEKLL
jgi:hypothetical protein